MPDIHEDVLPVAPLTSANGSSEPGDNAPLKDERLGLREPFSSPGWDIRVSTYEEMKMAEQLAMTPAAWQEPFMLADAFREREPVKFVIEGLFPLPSLSIVYGLPGDFKSMLLMDAAISVVSGDPWLPSLSWANGKARQVLQVPTLWYDCDNGRRRCEERFQALATHRGLSASSKAPFYYLSIPDPTLDASDSKSVSLLLKGLIKRLEIKFVCIDNLSTISGNADENSLDMGRVMSNLRTLVEETNIACVIIHHQRKGNNEACSGESLRGHSSINATVDLALQMRRDPDTDRVTIQSTKTRGAVVPPFGAEFTYSSRPDKELDTARFHGIPARGTGHTELSEAVLLALTTKGELNQLKVIEEAKDLGHGKTTVIKALKKLVEENRVKVKSGNKRNAKLYSLA